MELELNIYEKGEVVKTHKAATHILPWGIVEDALEIIDDGDETLDLTSETTLFASAMPIIRRSMGLVRELMPEIFPDLTTEEMRKTSTEEVVRVVMTVIMYAFKGIKEISPQSGKKK
jgi:hypothetical protein